MSAFQPRCDKGVYRACNGVESSGGARARKGGWTVKDHPILFNSAMVRAILEGRKTQTRRIVKPQSAVLTDAMARLLGIQPPTKENQVVIPCPYGQVGDRLWVKETWRPAITDSESLIQYKADGGLREISPSIYLDEEWFLKAAITEWKWRSSRYMPRWASRIDLEITGIRVERVQDISEADLEKEGMEAFRDECMALADFDETLTHRQLYEIIWNSLNAKRGFGWDVNPWVWVIEFKRVEGSK